MKLTEEQKEHRRESRLWGLNAKSWIQLLPIESRAEDRATAAKFSATNAAHHCFLAHPELRGDDK